MCVEKVEKKAAEISVSEKIEIGHQRELSDRSCFTTTDRRSCLDRDLDRPVVDRPKSTQAAEPSKKQRARRGVDEWVAPPLRCPQRSMSQRPQVRIRRSFFFFIIVDHPPRRATLEAEVPTLPHQRPQRPVGGVRTHTIGLQRCRPPIWDAGRPRGPSRS
jgi:hypothetical protein